MMLVYGMTTMMRRWPCVAACFKANASEESVLPLPVGAVSENRPGGLSAAVRQSARRCCRSWFTSPSAGLASKWDSRRDRARSACNTGTTRCAGTFGSKCLSVSRKSASTRQLNSNRVRSAFAKWSDGGLSGGSGRESPSSVKRVSNSARDSEQPVNSRQCSVCLARISVSFRAPKAGKPVW